MKDTGESLNWQRGQKQFQWRDSQVSAPKPLLWAAELPGNTGVAFVTLFDESTPKDEPNAFVYDEASGTRPVKIYENGELVRMLGSYSEKGAVVFNAVNQFEYLVNPITLAVLSHRYYR
jgi:hypothetical protein